MHISSSLSCVSLRMSLCICGLSSIPVDSRLPSRVTGLLFPTPSSLRKCVGIPALTIISRSSSGSLTDKDLDHAPLSLSGTFPSSSRFCNQMCLSLLRRLHLSFLTYKTVFLIALASASRVSELHALSRQDVLLSGMRTVMFRFPFNRVSWRRHSYQTCFPDPF